MLSVLALNVDQSLIDHLKTKTVKISTVQRKIKASDPKKGLERTVAKTGKSHQNSTKKVPKLPSSALPGLSHESTSLAALFLSGHLRKLPQTSLICAHSSIWTAWWSYFVSGGVAR